MKTSNMGFNKTGIRAAPGDSEALIASLSRAEAPVAPPPADGAADALRASYFRDADPLGSVPPPDSMKGIAAAGATLLHGGRMQALIDKLGERLAFERSGVRLYEAFLRKCRLRSEECGPIAIETVEAFMREELQHFALLRDAIERLGGDATAQTPCADVVGVQTAGLMHSVLDPRTTVLQSLHALLAAELVDEAGWGLLIALVKEADQEEIADAFQRALAEEERHLGQVRAWYEAMCVSEQSVGRGDVANA